MDARQLEVNAFRTLLDPVFAVAAGKPLDRSLAEELERTIPPESERFAAIERACHAAIAAGWMCSQGGAGRRYGRVITPGDDTRGFSVDVVDLVDIVGPHHRHPNGEICMIMPVSSGARFDEQPRGWCVYGPGSAHRPTVTGGEALVLYLLPEGKIEFTGQ